MGNIIKRGFKFMEKNSELLEASKSKAETIDNKIKLSILVPCYNVEKYLKKCLKSVLSQTMKEIEVICINDGSKDSTLEILKKFAKKDSRVKIIDKPNSGYGNSMNRGLDAAKGEYIGIVESDDYVEKDMCEVLYNVAKKYDLDVVKSDYMTFNTVKGKEKTIYEPTCTDHNYYNKVLIPSKNKIIFSFQMNTWTGIYKNSFIKSKNIRHNETPGASYQDNGFWFQTLSLAKTVMFVNRAFYHYRQDNPNSSINSKGKVFCMNEEYAFIHNFMDEHPFVKENFMNEYFKKKFFNYMHTYERIADEYKLEFLERFSQELKETQNNKEINFAKMEDGWISSMSLRIMDDYKRFYYEDTLWKMQKKLENAQERLDRLRNSREIKVGRKYADKILKFLGKERL